MGSKKIVGILSRVNNVLLAISEEGRLKERHPVGGRRTHRQGVGGGNDISGLTVQGRGAHKRKKTRNAGRMVKEDSKFLMMGGEA